MKAVMVWGATSGAGKSWLATALCRWYRRRGLRVAPYKAQNMSNNARVVPGLDGRPGEIGSAQYFQALAAGIAPDVRINPVLLKPEADTRSQVVVLGAVDAALADMPWHRRSAALWPRARDALESLLAEFDLVVIEGAGSPAEINLQASDYVNLETARTARPAGLLVADIDRGGAFAHLYGTQALMPPDVRGHLRGFVMNRFRGDAALLSPGPEMLQAMCGVPTLAVLPMWRGHGLPEEDGLHDAGASALAGRLPVIAVVAGPYLSNLDEFQPLAALTTHRLRWARTDADLDDAAWIVLPGSKQTARDLAWLRAAGLDAAIARHVAAGRPLLGLCGGLQMLGRGLLDPEYVEGAAATDDDPRAAKSAVAADADLQAAKGAVAAVGASAPPAAGLGLLPIITRYERPKLLCRTRATFGTLAGPWAALSGLAFEGYEIRHGRTEAEPGTHAAVRSEDGRAIGWQQGPVLGLYAHGLFESAPVVQALFGEPVRPLDAVFDGLADYIDRHFAPGALEGLLTP